MKSGTRFWWSMTRLACTPKMCGCCFEMQAWIRTVRLKELLLLVEVCAHIEGINEIKQQAEMVLDLRTRARLSSDRKAFNHTVFRPSEAP